MTDTNDAVFAYPACRPAQGGVMGKTGSSAGGEWGAAWRGHKTVLIHVVGKAAPDTRLAAVVLGETKDEPERATVRR